MAIKNADRSVMIAIDEALRILRMHLPPRREAAVPFQEALGCILAEDLVARHDIPPFHRSAMDGYALRAQDAAAVPVDLALVGEIRAGGGDPGKILPGQAKAIMTGAPLPEGADAVQMLEKTERSGGAALVRILESVGIGENVRPRGYEAAEGTVVLEAGRHVGPSEIAVMASFGYIHASVWRKPTVALVSTGDELVEVQATPKADQIRNSNAYSLAAQLRFFGVNGEHLGIARDSREDIRLLVEEGLKRDILILTGGVSVGEYDFVKEVFQEVGIEILFSKVAVRPGKPTVFACRENHLIFGLPGNPVSSFVTFELFVRPVLGWLCGIDRPELARIRGTLPQGMRQAVGRTSFLPAWADRKREHWVVRPLDWQGSGDIVGFSRGNALVIFPGDRDSMAAGETVEALLLPDHWDRCAAAATKGELP